MKLRLRNIGTMILHGRHPGEEWIVIAGDDGKAVNQLWRKRLLDEEQYNVGILAIVGHETGTVVSPEPDLSRPATVPDIGPFIELFSGMAKRVTVLELKPAQLIPTPVDIRQLSQQIQQPLNDQHAHLMARVEALEGMIKAALSQ
jgi:hypothetical protein